MNKKSTGNQRIFIKKIENYKKLTQVNFADVFKRRQNIVATGKRKW